MKLPLIALAALLTGAHAAPVLKNAAVAPRKGDWQNKDNEALYRLDYPDYRDDRFRVPQAEEPGQYSNDLDQFLEALREYYYKQAVKDSKKTPKKRVKQAPATLLKAMLKDENTKKNTPLRKKLAEKAAPKKTIPVPKASSGKGTTKKPIAVQKQAPEELPAKEPSPAKKPAAKKPAPKKPAPAKKEAPEGETLNRPAQNDRTKKDTSIEKDASTEKETPAKKETPAEKKTPLEKRFGFPSFMDAMMQGYATAYRQKERVNVNETARPN